ncbi:hypothetical protein RB653_008662 [Dictyostelium firmibasis]|uniref:IPT/TIG domain-containing protein n=1 Tax=Dictyostelium firmibasis TaxID=79012 RepID=A0AAN7YRP9_9MYCE
MKILYILLVIICILNLVKAGFDVSVEGKKLVYVGTKVDKFLTSIILTDKNCPTIKIIFTCTRKGKDGCICKSTDLDFTKLIGSTVTFNGRYMDGKDITTQHQIIGMPVPPPKDLKFIPSTEAGLSLVTGNFLRFGYDVKTLKVIIGGKPKTLNLDPPIPKDATKFNVQNIGGSGSFTVQLGSSSFKLNFAPPSIQKIESTNGQLTITGSNFYVDKKLVKILIGNEVLTSSIISVKNDLIEFNYEPKLTQATSIKVEVDGLSSTLSQFKFTPVPLSINSVPNSGGVVTISGKCLKGASGDKSKTTISIGTYPCEIVSQISTEIICKLPPSNEQGGSKNLKVFIDIDNILNTNQLQYSYGIPKILSIKQKGVTFIIEGTSLGSKDISRITVTDQNKEENTITPTDDDDGEKSLVFTLPSKIFGGNIVVTHNEDISNVLDFFTSPFLTEPLTLAPTEGGLFEISGFYLNPLGVKPTVQIENTGKTNPIECTNVVQAIDGSKLSCTLSAGTGNKMVAVVSYGNSNNQPFRIVFSYQPPFEILTTQKQNILEIEGENLGSDSSLVELTLNNGVIKADSVKNNVASFTLLETSLSDNNAIIIVDGLSSDPNGFKISILPVCKSISSPNTDGGKISIVGSYFDSKSTTTVMVSEKPCTSVTVFSSTTLECIAPKGSGANNPVIISVGDVQVQSQINLSYNLPTIVSVTKVDQIKGGNVTIIGSNFADSESNSITINSRNCKNIVVVDSFKMECSLEPLIVTNDTITSDPESKSFINVTINGQSFGDNIFEWGKPESETPSISSSPITLLPSQTPSIKSNSTLKPNSTLKSKPTPTPNLNSNNNGTNTNTNNTNTENDENNHSNAFKICQSFSLILVSVVFYLFSF